MAIPPIVSRLKSLILDEALASTEVVRQGVIDEGVTQIAAVGAEGTTQVAAVTAAATALVNQAASAALQGRMRVDDKTTYISVAPSATWNGTAGTGFASTPIDPTRTTAKPACRLIEPPNQAFTDYKVVGVSAFANNLGALDNCGLKSVTFHYEGGTAVVTQPSFYSFPDVNGKTVTYFGWWAVLLHNGTNGDARLYAEAVPKNTAMQNRVIGPFTFFPSAAVYDLELTVAPSLAVVAGSRYQSIFAAVDYCRTQAKKRPHITITEARTDYLLGTGTFNYSPAGYITIDATVPVTIIGTATYADATPRMKADGLHFKGSNITIDYISMHSIYHENIGIPHWFDGVTLLNSGGRGYAVPQIKGPRTASPSRSGAYFTECTFTAMPSTMTSALLARGPVATLGFADCVSEAQCVIGARIDDYDAYADWAKYTPSFTVTYTGAGATATLELSGISNGTSRTFTAKVDGVSVGTQDVTLAAATAVSTVVAWLNGLTGWIATTQDDTRRANLTSLSNNAGAAFGPQNVKSVTLQLYSFYDVHGDFYQQNSPANLTENVIVTDTIITNFAGQAFFISSTSVANDFVFVNVAYHDKGVGGTFLSQLGRTGAKSHVVFAHISSTQEFLLRTALGSGTGGWNADAYCMFANDAIKAISWDGTPDTDIRIANNHYYGTSGLPSGDVGGTAGGDASTLWQSIATGDVTPKGALLTNLKLPVLGRDYLGRRRSKADAAGAAV